MIHELQEIFMKRVFLYIIVLFLSVAPVFARTVELTLYPAKVTKPAKEYRLVPKTDELIDADAAPLYRKAVKSIPDEFEAEQIREWLKLPVKQLPQEQVEVTLQKYREILKLLSRAARCKECNWPKFKPWTQSENLNEYFELARVLKLRARLEISRGRDDSALLAMQTAFGMVRHLAEAPTVIQAQIAAAVGCVMCKEVEQFVKEIDSPNLYWALANLPRPLVDMSKAIESETASLKDYNLLLRRQVEKQLRPAYDRMRMIEKRLDTYLNALQCVEAIRNYAAVHNGRPPEKLSDISELEIPRDMMSGNEFKYHCTCAGVVLQSIMPEGGNKQDSIQYKIVLKK